MNPKKSLRARLALNYGCVFFVASTVLVGVMYFLVRHNVGPVRAIVTNTANTELSLLPQRRADHAAWQKTLAEVALLFGILSAASIVFGWVLAGRALRPMGEILRIARQASDAERLGERVGLKGRPDELKQLGDAIDSMLERVDAVVSTQKRFIADVSHELRTPLAVMRAGIDVSLTDPDATEEERRQATQVLSESILQAEALIQSLLALARSEQASEARMEVDLAEIVAQSLAEVTEGIEERGLQLDAALEPVYVLGDPPLLRVLAANLLRNAVAYNRPRGTIDVAVKATPDGAELRVSNTGDVVLEDEVAGLFEPFRRSRASRSTGAGLGLAIAKSVTEAHHGSIGANANESGGLSVRVSLPAPHQVASSAEAGRGGHSRRRGLRGLLFVFLVICGLAAAAGYAAFAGAVSVARVPIVHESDAKVGRAVQAFPLVWSGMAESNVLRVAGEPSWAAPSRVCPVKTTVGIAATQCWPGQRCLEYGDIESDQSVEFCFQGGLVRKKWWSGRAWQEIVDH